MRSGGLPTLLTTGAPHTETCSFIWAGGSWVGRDGAWGRRIWDGARDRVGYVAWARVHLGGGRAHNEGRARCYCERCESSRVRGHSHDTHMTHYTGHSGVSWAAVSKPKSSQDQSQDLIKAYPYDIPPYRLWPSSRVGLPGFETLPRWACRLSVLLRYIL